MKILKDSFAFLFLLVFSISVASPLSAQKKISAKDSVIKSLLDQQRYVFFAQNVTPMNGRQRFLTSDYTVYVSKDSVISDLPYFGRAYSAPINPSEGGIQFTSTDFSYNISQRKKGRWDIAIQPKDIPNARQLNLTVFNNGTASLQVTGTDRQPISFSGYITEKSKRR